MKGGRLERPDPQAHLVAAATPADDWVDGSWTVDCSCGVTFDDGEEMVSCDECSVWVHTRCARYVRGVHTSFSCHNCRSKRAPSSADEAEVAELLAELPTHRPPPLFRRWAEVPLPARVHVHGLPGGGDSVLFCGVPAFSAGLWRCTGYVPKRFGFRYYEFPSWADDKDNGADALFALAREKLRETSDCVPISGIEPKQEKHYIQSLSCRGKKIDGGQHAVSPLADAKKRGVAEPDIWENGCQPREGETMPGTVHEDDFAETNMAICDWLSFKTKNKTEEPGEAKCFKETPSTLKKSEGLLKLEANAVEQEEHSGSARLEVMYKQQAEVKGSLKSEQVNSGTKKVHDMRGHQDQLNLISNMQDVVGLPDVQRVQSETQVIKRDPVSQGNDTADATQLSSDCYKQGLDTSASLIAQRYSSKSTYVSLCSELSKSEAGILMHTVVERPNLLPGTAKVCTSFSGAISIPCEVPQSVDKEPSSTGNTGRLVKRELVSPTDIKLESAKFNEESTQQVTGYDKVQPKCSISSAPRSYQESKKHESPAVKPRLPASKEQSQKTATTGGTSVKSLHGELPPLQSRNKAAGPSFSQRKDKIHQRTVHVTQECSNNSTSTELRASDSTASLTDEQLALLLHQQLNSSPRVPRVPRCHQAAGSQMLHPTGASVFSKRSSVGGRDNATVIKKRNRDDTLKDNDTRRTEKASFVDQRHKDSSAEHVPSMKDSHRPAENILSEQKSRSFCSTGADTGLTKNYSVDSSDFHNLPGLIDEIISKNRSITHEELCGTVHQHVRDMTKPSEEDQILLHAINDCLRKRREWAHLVDQTPKTNSNKRRKGEESDSLLADVLQAETMRPEMDSEEGSPDLHQEDLPRGKRKARKRRRLELKGRRVRDTRKRSNIDSSSEDAGATLSDSSSDRNDNPMDDVNQEDNYVTPQTGGSYIKAKGTDSSSYNQN